MLREEHMIIKLSNLGNIEAGWFSLICIYALEKYNIDWRQNMKSWVVTNYFWNVWRHISVLYIKDQEYRTLSLISFEWCRFGPCCFEHLSGFIPRDLIVYDYCKKLEANCITMHISTEKPMQIWKLLIN